MSIPAPMSWLPLGRYVCGTVLDNPNTVALFGADTPDQMLRLALRGRYELWATAPIVAPIAGISEAEPPTRMFWLIETALSDQQISGYILETALITPNDDDALLQLTRHLRVCATAQYEEPRAL